MAAAKREKVDKELEQSLTELSQRIRDRDPHLIQVHLDEFKFDRDGAYSLVRAFRAAGVTDVSSMTTTTNAVFCEPPVTSSSKRKRADSGEDHAVRQSPIRSVWIPDDLFHFFADSPEEGDGNHSEIRLFDALSTLPQLQELYIGTKNRSHSSGIYYHEINLDGLLRLFPPPRSLFSHL